MTKKAKRPRLPKYSYAITYDGKVRHTVNTLPIVRRVLANIRKYVKPTHSWEFDDETGVRDTSSVKIFRARLVWEEMDLDDAILPRGKILGYKQGKDIGKGDYIVPPYSMLPVGHKITSLQPFTVNENADGPKDEDGYPIEKAKWVPVEGKRWARAEYHDICIEDEKSYEVLVDAPKVEA